MVCGCSYAHAFNYGNFPVASLTSSIHVPPFFMFKFYKLMGGESYTIIKIKMSITLLIKSTFLSVNFRTVLQEQFRHKSSQKYEYN